jgi:DNA-binding MarR family transcriptional regulator
LFAALERQMRMVSAQSVLFSQAAAERLGMNSTDMECLDLLSLNGPMPAGRLAELTGLTTGAITGVVDRLERAGYVRRERDPYDRRRVIVQPILERQAEAAPIFLPMAQATAELFARYDHDALAIILDFLTRANAIAQEQIARLRAEAKPPLTRPAAD